MDIQNKKNVHLIAIPFTGVGLHGGMRGNVWYKHRINIFKNYTLKSLANQGNKDFLIWMWFRPEEKDNPLTQEIAKAIEEAGLNYHFTFHGLMYHDDKFTDYTLKTKLKNLLQMLWDSWIYKEWKSPRELWKYTWDNKNLSLGMRLSFALTELGNAMGTDYEWVYMTRIDSDDMFHKEAVNLIQSAEPRTGKALVFDKGYIYNTVTGQLGSWNPPTNPPFHTIIFDSEIFFNPKWHLEYYGAFTSHEDIPKIFDCETLDMNKYMVSFHGKHISTGWESDPLRKAKHMVQYGKANPFREEIEPRGYLYSTSGRNISTKWQSHTSKVRNTMIGEEYETLEKKKEILKDFGIY